MLQRIEFVHFRKLKNLTVDFAKGLNAIAGVNGTCKSSLLYLASNSFQEVSTTDPRLSNPSGLKLLRNFVSSLNPKVETLTKGDKKFNDPAPGEKGSLFSVAYGDGKTLSFRRHNTAESEKSKQRFALKLYYKRGNSEKLPSLPVVYLGISRLIPYGEIAEEKANLKTRKALPEPYNQEFADLFDYFTHRTPQMDASLEIEGMKKRVEFTTEIDGIDSNTISAGEDNLSVVLTSLVALHAYYDSLATPEEVNSLLLIDELDATLHPKFQTKLLNKLREYSKKYGIQVIFTTQSSAVMENALQAKDNIIFLLDSENHVHLLSSPDKYQLQMHLSGYSEDHIFRSAKIPILVEDNEAKWMLEELLQFEADRNNQFAWIKNHFYVYSTKAGCAVLRNLFSDVELSQRFLGSICVLDGDCNSDVSKCIVALPGKAESPEALLFNYTEKLLQKEDSEFWDDEIVISSGFSPTYYKDEIQSLMRKIEDDINNGSKHSSERRVAYKKIFNDNQTFFRLVFGYWLKRPEHQSAIDHFFSELYAAFRKVCDRDGIPPNKWPRDGE